VVEAAMLRGGCEVIVCGACPRTPAGSVWAPLGSAPGWVLLLGICQGSCLGLAIFFTMARAPDPVTAASLSGFAQSAGYLIATIGPLATYPGATGSQPNWSALQAVAGDPNALADKLNSLLLPPVARPEHGLLASLLAA